MEGPGRKEAFNRQRGENPCRLCKVSWWKTRKQWSGQGLGLQQSLFFFLFFSLGNLRSADGCCVSLKPELVVEERGAVLCVRIPEMMVRTKLNCVFHPSANEELSEKQQRAVSLWKNAQDPSAGGGFIFENALLPSSF